MSLIISQFTTVILGLAILALFALNRTQERIIELQKSIIVNYKQVALIRGKQVKTLSYLAYRMTEKNKPNE